MSLNLQITDYLKHLTAHKQLAERPQEIIVNFMHAH